jgi:hypothetical protein
MPVRFGREDNREAQEKDNGLASTFNNICQMLRLGPYGSPLHRITYVEFEFEPHR